MPLERLSQGYHSAVYRFRPSLCSFVREKSSQHNRQQLRVQVAVEEDPRYRRVDLSDLHAYEARKQFAAAVQKGEAGINLAEAALHISAEDDAIASHSTVRLPVDAFLKRIEQLSGELATMHLRHTEDAEPEAILQAVQHYLFTTKGFRVPPSDRSNLPANSIVDHPGVWENASQAYLHEVLITKVGIAATHAIIFAQVMQNLLALGAISFAVRIECSRLDMLPEARILHGLPSEALVRPDGSVLNTCTSSALVELLNFLKRAYWPFSWQTGSDSSTAWTGGSGFKGAAEVALEGEASAELQAIARTAKHRLDRGIFTSPGAGDIRRAKAAAERLCILAGDDCPWQRRDAGVLLLHAGQICQAATELEAYHSSAFYRSGASSEERNLVERLLAMLHAHPDYVEDQCSLLSVESALAMPAPTESPMLPLTW